MAFEYSSFGDAIVWQLLMQLFILTAALLAGNTIRRKIKAVNRSLVPTALIGGFLILILKLIPGFNSLINSGIMEVVTYHCLAIGFIALALKTGQSKEKSSMKAILETGVLQGAVYIMQAAIGLIVTIVLSLVLAEGFFPGGGILLALGFGQGTGQALNYGKIFENDYGFVGGTTFGLTIATVGFFVASVVGVVYMNILRRRGLLKHTSHEQKNTEALADYVAHNDIPKNESVDRLTMNVGLVLIVYAIVYAVMKLVNVSLVWGFNFLLGSLVALLVKLLLSFLQKKKIMQHNFTNNYLLDRISGLVFDFMIIAGMSAIDLGALSDKWWQLTIICALGTIATFIYIRKVSRHLYKGYEEEAFFSIFGMLTGTASNGMILLREIDPAFETPASTNLVLSGLPAIVFGGALLILLGYAPKGFSQAVISVVILLVAFVVFTAILFRTKIFKKKSK